MRRIVAGLPVVVALAAIIWLLAGRPSGSGESVSDMQQEQSAGGDARHEAEPLEGTDPATEPPAGLRETAPELAHADIRGIVRDDATGEPLAGVKVLACASWGPGPRVRQTLTDGEGRYELTLRQGNWKLTTWHPGYVPAGLAHALANEYGEGWPMDLHVHVSPAGTSTTPEEIRLSPGTPFDIRVVDERGQPVPRARIHRRGRAESRAIAAFGWEDGAGPWEELTSLVADNAGRCSLAVLPPTIPELELAATAPGMVGAWQRLPANGPWAMTLIVRRPATVSGRVAHADGSPAVGLWVTVPTPQDFTGAAPEGARFTDTARSAWLEDDAGVQTDDEGKFTVTGCAPGSDCIGVLRLEPLEHVSTTALPPLVAGETQSGVELVIPRKYVLRIRVASGGVTSRNGESFRVSRVGLDLDGSKSWRHVRTHDKPTVAISLDSPGPWEVDRSTPAGWQRVLASVRLPADEQVVDLEPIAEPILWIEAVRPDGSRVEHFEVETWSLAGARDLAKSDHLRSATTRDGRLQVRVVGGLPAALRVEGHLERDDARPRDRQDLDAMRGFVRVAEPPASGTLRVVLGQPHELVGRVLAPDGQGVASCDVEVSQGRRRMVAERHRTDSSGRFMVSVRPGTEVVDVRVTPPAAFLAPAPVEHSMLDGPLTVHVRAALPLEGRIEVPAGVRFTGNEQAVVCWGMGEEDRSKFGGATVQLDVDGSFRFPSLPSDTDIEWSYRGRVLEREGLLIEPPTRTTRAGQLLVVGVVSGRFIEGRVEARTLPDLLNVSASPKLALARGKAAGVDGSGRFRIGPLLPGPYRIRLHNGRAGGAVLDETQGHAGDTDVLLQAPELDWLELRCPTGRSGYHANAYVAATHEFAGRARAGEDGVLRLRLPTGRRYDVAVTTESDQRTNTPLAGHVAGLEPGTTHEVELVPTLPLAGPIQSQGEWRWYRLAARQGSARFALIQQGYERFFAYLPPGRYDLVSQDADGVEQVHARNIEAGRVDVVLELR
ncbi:MAG: carboxypeptidase-like regulatory domain-containing protein [Planctomycetota bacterium]